MSSAPLPPNPRHVARGGGARIVSMPWQIAPQADHPRCRQTALCPGIGSGNHCFAASEGAASGRGIILDAAPHSGLARPVHERQAGFNLIRRGSTKCQARLIAPAVALRGLEPWIHEGSAGRQQAYPAGNVCCASVDRTSVRPRGLPGEHLISPGLEILVRVSDPIEFEIEKPANDLSLATHSSQKR
jgi:hypothetical protein